MKNNEALQETMEMSAIVAVEEEELDMKQDNQERSGDPRYDGYRKHDSGKSFAKS